MKKIQFLYLVENEPYVGSIDDIVKAIETANYAGLEVNLTCWELTGEGPIPQLIFIHTSEFNDDDYAVVTVSINGEEADYTVDGRA